MQSIRPIDYLKIDIANNAGHDKLSWNERIAWFDANESQLSSLKDIENPALFFAGIQAYKDARAGIPSGYAPAFDATSSGMQILACLTGDRKAAELCNVVPNGKRNDAYTSIYNTMKEDIGSSGSIQRTDVKQAILTSLYGSEKIPKEVFGTGNLLDSFENTMSKHAPLVWELNKAWLDLWDPNKEVYEWTMPDNFHVKCKVRVKVEEVVQFNDEPVTVTYKVNAPSNEGRSLGANTTHSIDGYIYREMVRRCMHDRNKITEVERILFTEWNMPELVTIDSDTLMVITLWNLYLDTGMLSARILDHINETNVWLVDRDVVLNLINSLPAKPFQIHGIHDCFRALPAYCNDMRQQYNNLLSELAKSNMLQYLLKEVVGVTTTVTKGDPHMWKDIINADYALS